MSELNQARLSFVKSEKARSNASQEAFLSCHSDHRGLLAKPYGTDGHKLAVSWCFA